MKLSYYQKYGKYCKTGQHFVNHLVKRYCIHVKYDKNKVPIRILRQTRMCKQCAEYAGDWSITLKKARIEVITRTLLR